MKRAVWAVSWVAVLAGCGTEEAAPGGGTVAVARLEGAPTEAAVESSTLALDGEAAALSVLSGSLAVAAGDGVQRVAADGATLVEVSVLAGSGEPASTGAVTWMARRGEGLLVLGAEGLFHTQDGALLPSPLGASFGESTLTQVDVLGDTGAEEAWLVVDGEAHWVAAGQAVPFGVPEAGGAPDALVGVAPGVALYAGGGSVWQVDVAAGTYQLVASDLGTATSFDRAEDGAVLLATEGGLLARSADGDFSLRTFAPAGAPALSVHSVASAYGATVAVVEDALVAIDETGARRLGDAADSGPRSVAVDASGDTWIAQGPALRRFATGVPVSFAEDVAPFFAAHCDKCHAAGTEETVPDVDFADYELVVSMAEDIVERLQRSGPGVMPPASSEVLGTDDYALVLRWADGGRAP
ncbi:MAG: hypothetical protein WKG00_24250 [Polyangiaceae bacterium]